MGRKPFTLGTLGKTRRLVVDVWFWVSKIGGR